MEARAHDHERGASWNADPQDDAWRARRFLDEGARVLRTSFVALVRVVLVFVHRSMLMRSSQNGSWGHGRRDTSRS